MSRNCKHCGKNGHNSRSCCGDAACETSFMLFGVRLTTSQGASFRKSVSMNNLSQYEHSHDRHADAASCYDSDDVVHASGRSRERKRGVPWTEDEHRLFLLGLQKVGKGDWRGISRNFVKTRTPTQVASHAQKYFLRRNNLNRRRRRSSLFDITDTCLGSEVEEQAAFNQESVNSLPPPPPAAQPRLSSSGIGVGGFPVSLSTVGLPANGDGNYSPENIISSPPQTPKLIRPIPTVPVPPSSKMADLNLNPKSSTSETALLPLSLKPSTPSSDEQSSPTSASTTPPSSSASALQGMRGHGDGIISVA